MDSPLQHAMPPLLTEDAALFVDFDGTLVELCSEPMQAVVPKDLPDLLSGLRARLHGAAAVISGRRLTDLDSLLSPTLLAGAGLHGAELRVAADSGIEVRGVPEITRLCNALRQHFAADTRITIDHTECTVRLNHALAHERRDECRTYMNLVATARILEVIEHEDCIEARPHGLGKGFAVRMLLENFPFTSRRPVFIGNGITDEDAFRAVSAAGGFGIKIGDGDTAASYRLSSVRDLHLWLRRSLQSLTKSQPELVRIDTHYEHEPLALAG